VTAALAGVEFGNPSSPHAEGRAARARLDEARDRAAAALGTAAREIVFCASGTEAINLAVLGTGRRLAPDARVVTWQAEHQAVLGPVRQLQTEGRPVELLPVDASARARVDGLPADTGLVSLGLANNEVGSVQPVQEIAARAHGVGALVHLDACQGPQWLPPPLHQCDLASFSGHKLGAGRGGLLWIRSDVRQEPLLHGGPQEWGRRAGREDVEAAVAMAVALEVCHRRRHERAAFAAKQSARLRECLRRLGGELTGGPHRLPNFASVTFSRRRGEDILLALDLAGLAASSGSACASGSLDPSHVLLAAGYTMAEALGSLRLTLSYATTDKDVDRGLEILERVLAPILAS
jgi:cysteine desulfurase